jgi:hypothetical protein
MGLGRIDPLPLCQAFIAVTRMLVWELGRAWPAEPVGAAQPS